MEKKMIDTYWEAFVKEHFLNGGVRPEIAFSWEISHSAEVDPFAAQQVPSLAPAAQQEIIENNRELIRHGMQLAAHMEQALERTQYIVGLTNRNGVIINLSNSIERITGESDFPLKVGVPCTEQSIGTTAIGLCFRLRAPTHVSFCEHYQRQFHGLNSYAAPVMDGNNLLGILFLLVPGEQENLYCLSTVVMAAIAIERSLQKNRKERANVRALQDRNAIINSVSQGIIALDDERHIIYCNESAGRILRTENISDLMYKKIFSVLDGSDKNLGALIEEGRIVKDVEVTLRMSDVPRKYLLSTRQLTEGEGQSSFLLLFEEFKRARNIASKISGAVAITRFVDLKGSHPSFISAMETAKRIAKRDVNVLLIGESGTGKDLFAQAIHNESDRHDGPFVALNCGAIPKELIGSELFGYVEGAFTGAHKGGNPGKFELAEGGTIFLDEIGEMPLELQVQLLRVIENKNVTRIGGKDIIPLDVRVIAATNRDLRENMHRGLFRKDLYYRLNTMTISLPSLRERVSDIEPLARHFYGSVLQNDTIAAAGIPADFLQALERYPWPGNIRELRNAVERCVHLSRDGKLRVENLPEEMSSQPPTPALPMAPAAPLELVPSQEALAPKPIATERDVILSLLEQHGGNISKVAEAMGVARSTLYRKLRKYGLDRLVFYKNNVIEER